MKVLFAVSNEGISESIIKKYQKEYKQIISYKNVYYFNAILKELQKDKTYDRIVISEDLEAFTNTQYDQIDKFIFEKLDGISDEASNTKGNDIPIILICSDRRTKAEEMLVKLFGIGIYNAIIGTDRSVDEVCRLINRPRSKKDAKQYYKIESEDVNYKSENENDVSELEIQNILAHYKRLGKNEDKYIDSFNNIAAQYNDTQLRIITKFLPLTVRAVLEEKSPKYQQIMSFNNKISDKIRKPTTEVEEGPSEKLLKSATKNKIMSEPVVIPSAVNLNSGKKLARTKSRAPEILKTPKVKEPEKIEEEIIEEPIEEIVKEPIKEPIKEPSKESSKEPAKRQRGRPRKKPLPPEDGKPAKKQRGRPRKKPLPEPAKEEVEEIAPIMPIPEEDDEEENTTILPGFEEIEEIEPIEEPQPVVKLEPVVKPEPMKETSNNHEEAPIMPMIEKKDENITNYSNTFFTKHQQIVEPEIEKIDLSYLLTPDKKIVTFVGTSKNGTSFLVNNLAQELSSAGVNTAILDTTQNKNSYYIYTDNEERLRNVAAHSIDNLANGIANGIKVNNNLTVYTSLPDEGQAIVNSDKILETLLKNHSLILIDTDFKTPLGYFEKSQETYLVQTLDILTIQPLTAFLRDLKSKNILDEKKLRVIINKAVKIKGITEKTIIGGMAYYNDPAMSFMTELFDRTLMRYVSIPFEEETYIRYLQGVIDCKISLKGYSKLFMQTLKELSNMVYPLTNTYRPQSINNGFSANMNNTLNQMRNNY